MWHVVVKVSPSSSLQLLVGVFVLFMDVCDLFCFFSFFFFPKQQKV